ncbi:hypothetical protein ACFPRL_12820 [Pseudoclavibacter helvolus]
MEAIPRRRRIAETKPSQSSRHDTRRDETRRDETSQAEQEPGPTGCETFLMNGS